MTLEPLIQAHAAAVVLVQVTRMLTKFALPTAPVPPLTTHVCAGLEGCVSTVTLYAAPAARAVAKVNAPLAVMVRLSAALSCNTSPVPDNPVTVPPMVYVAGGGGVVVVELPPPQAEKE